MSRTNDEIEIERQVGPRIHSYRTQAAFYVLLDGKWHSAFEISQYTGEPSKQVYPRLKKFFNRFVEVTYSYGRNVYRLHPNVIGVVKKIWKYLSKAGRVSVYVTRFYLKYGLKLDEVSSKILEFLASLFKVTGKKWFEGSNYDDLIIRLSEAVHEKTRAVEEALLDLVKMNVITVHKNLRYFWKIRITEKILNKLMDDVLYEL